MTPVVVPDLGDGIDKVEVACWHVLPGAAVGQGDDIVELVADKASFNIASPADGTLRVVHVPAGQEAAVGTVLGEVG